MEMNGRTLVDGGLVNPIPIAPTLNDSTDFTIAVNLSGSVDKRGKPKKVEAKPRQPGDDAGYREKISSFVNKLLEDDDPAPESPDAAELLVKSIDVMQGAIARLKLAAYAPDLVVKIPRDACTFFEFHRAEEMADLGYERACLALDNLEF